MLWGVTFKVEEACRVLLSWMISITQEIQVFGVCLFYVVDLILSVHVSVDIEFASCALKLIGLTAFWAHRCNLLKTAHAVGISDVVQVKHKLHHCLHFFLCVCNQVFIPHDVNRDLQFSAFFKKSFKISCMSICNVPNPPVPPDWEVLRVAKLRLFRMAHSVGERCKWGAHIEYVSNTDNDFVAFEIYNPRLNKWVVGFRDPNAIIHNLLSFHSLNLQTCGCDKMNVAPCRQTSCLLKQATKECVSWSGVAGKADSTFSNLLSVEESEFPVKHPLTLMPKCLIFAFKHFKKIL